jgi:glycerol-3-phosphate acyltransferase PlsY
MRPPTETALAHALFFVSGHVPPLLRNFKELFLEKGIARLFGVLFALSRLGAVLFCPTRHVRCPRLYAT